MRCGRHFGVACFRWTGRECERKSRQKKTWPHAPPCSLCIVNDFASSVIDFKQSSLSQCGLEFYRHGNAHADCIDYDTSSD